MNREIFREYDIRGIADKDLTDDVIELLGKALGTYARKAYGLEDLKVAIGNDMRLSSERLRDALTRGLNDVGADVQHLGLVPTAAVYFSSYHLDVNLAIQITGSHNPAEYNGFKMMIGHDTLCGDLIQDLRLIIESGDFIGAKDGKKGTHEAYPSILADYLSWIKNDITLGDRKLNVIVDCGNGAGGVCAEELLKQTLEQNGEILFGEPDGNFPNHHPDPTVAANLKDLCKRVQETGADVGIAYDGDADRIGICDENGQIVFGDTFLILLSREVLKANPGATIIGEVKCSQKLFDDISNHGGVPIMSRVGHSLIKEKLRETAAKLAGEMSGHIFYNDRFFGFDDALYTTARLVEILSHTDKSVSDLLADVPVTFATPELREDCPEEKKFKVPGLVAEHYAAKGFETTTIDGVRVNFGDGWALCRASNTQPVLSLRVEASSEERRDSLLADLKQVVKESEARL